MEEHLVQCKLSVGPVLGCAQRDAQHNNAMRTAKRKAQRLLREVVIEIGSPRM